MSFKKFTPGELRECPFCGNDAVFHYIKDSRYHCWVECENGDADIGMFSNDELAIKHWNTRPAEDALQAEIERLKSDLEMQENLIRQMYLENNRAWDEVEGWKKLFYDLVDKQASVSTDQKVLVIGKDTNAGSAEENR